MFFVFLINVENVTKRHNEGSPYFPTDPLRHVFCMNMQPAYAACICKPAYAACTHSNMQPAMPMQHAPQA
jgi:hypothetical protein